MSETETPAPTRGRRSRAEIDSARRERRYSPDMDGEGTTLHLWVDESKLDRSTFHYRWVADVHDRIRRLERQDWDVVSDEEIGFTTDRSGDVQATAGRENVRMRLMRKYKDWFDDDQAMKQKRIEDQMDRAARGEEIIAGKGQDQGGGLTLQNAYRPNSAGANKL